MQDSDQSKLIEFLKQQEAGSAANVRVITTHISVVVLSGERAWKLKRAVRLPYADFSTPALRLNACEREVLLNRRTAPTLYIAARRITRQADGNLAMDGPGELVDAVVEMRRFDDDTLFSKLARSGALHRPLLTALARDLARFHEQAEIRPGEGAPNIEAVLALNEQSADLARVLDPAAVNAMRQALREGLEQHRTRLDARAQAGQIRLCHGDLHLSNLCLVDGKPTLFDCIEFNDTLATIDVLYDLAFLLMDLWQAGLKEEANWLMNRYLDASDQTDGLPLLAYFMALRASIRAQVLATHACLPDEPQPAPLAAEADSYLRLALELLKPAAVRLLAIGGLSGSGKSTRAAAIAHHIGAAPGARILATDRIRKKLAGVSAETRLPPESYTSESSRRVYDALQDAAMRTLNAGHSVIADAVFSRPQERDAIAGCALQAGVDFQGLWLEAAPATLLARVEARQNDPSDATPEVVRTQIARGAGIISWESVASSASTQDVLKIIGV